MNILKLVAQLSLDGTRFKSGLREATVATNRFGNNVSNNIKGQLAGAFGTAALVAFTKKMIDYGSAIHDAAKRTKTNSEALQEEVFWAQQSGASLQDLIMAYRGLGKARDEALGGNDDKLQAFADLGIDRAQLQAQTLSQTFRQIAEAARTLNLGSDEAPLLEKVLGKNAGSLASAFSESLSDAAAEARRLGAVLKDEVVDSLDAAGDELDKLMATLRGRGGESAAGLFSFARTALEAFKFHGSGIVGYLGARAEGVSHDDAVKIAYEVMRESVDDAVAVDFKKAEIVDRATRDAARQGVGPALGNQIDPAAVRERLRQLDAMISGAEKSNTSSRSDINSLVSTGQFAGRDFVANQDRSAEIALMRQELGVMKDQLATLKNVETNTKRAGKSLIVNP